MKQNILKYEKLKAQGKTPTEIFKCAKNDGYKNFECINLLMALFDMPLHQARDLAHYLHLCEKKTND
jgi:hypothetical protein